MGTTNITLDALCAKVKELLQNEAAVARADVYYSANYTHPNWEK